MERLDKKEINNIIDKLKRDGLYEKFVEMINDDFENHHIVYKLDSDEMIALAYKNNTIPFKMQEYYDWHEINLLIEEDLD
ncbi:hypothetical protein [Fusobacterium sp.]|uniref:hypothetical protein n=3 Tax=Fusobacterium sp. TaxID=68766 RepID=UPI00260FC1CA|nr:hypothetical protein [Fusobacterium sp.]